MKKIMWAILIIVALVAVSMASFHMQNDSFQEVDIHALMGIGAR